MTLGQSTEQHNTVIILKSNIKQGDLVCVFIDGCSYVYYSFLKIENLLCFTVTHEDWRFSRAWCEPALTPHLLSCVSQETGRAGDRACSSRSLNLSVGKKKKRHTWEEVVSHLYSPRWPTENRMCSFIVINIIVMVAVRPSFSKFLGGNSCSPACVGPDGGQQKRRLYTVHLYLLRR